MSQNIFLYGTDNWPSNLLRCDYKKHPKNKHQFIRDTAHGRFHGIIKNAPYRLELHFDLLIDGKHVSSLPLHHFINDEIKRIMKIGYFPVVKNPMKKKTVEYLTRKIHEY